MNNIAQTKQERDEALELLINQKKVELQGAHQRKDLHQRNIDSIRARIKNTVGPSQYLVAELQNEEVHRLRAQQQMDDISNEINAHTIVLHTNGDELHEILQKLEESQRTVREKNAALEQMASIFNNK